MILPAERPELLTARLQLRPFRQADAFAVAELASRPEIADTTLNVPHPYTLAMAEEWISGHDDAFQARALANFGLFERQTSRLVGTVGLTLKPEHHRGDIGYWIGVSFWGRGYATEGAAAVVAFGFEELRLNRITAGHFVGNAASGAVIRKLGMRHEGTLRQHVRKNDRFVDIQSYAILREEWQAMNGTVSVPVSHPGT